MVGQKWRNLTPEERSSRKKERKREQMKRYRKRKKLEFEAAKRAAESSSSSSDEDLREPNMENEGFLRKLIPLEYFHQETDDDGGERAQALQELQDGMEEDLQLEAAEDDPDDPCVQQDQIIVEKASESEEFENPRIQQVPMSRMREQKAEIAHKLASIKCQGNISDMALERVFKLCVDNAGTLNELKKAKVITSSYKKSLRPVALEQVPKVYCSALIKDQHPDTGVVQYVWKKNLLSIPREVLHPPSPSKCLRLEAYVKIKDIKEMHLKNHELNAEDAQKHLKNIALSCDGVEDSKHSSRTFTIVSIRINRCIYVTRIFHYLCSDKEARPNQIERVR
jgi:hypothetical protein